jgi:hypothetical protein
LNGTNIASYGCCLKGKFNLAQCVSVGKLTDKELGENHFFYQYNVPNGTKKHQNIKFNP